MNIESGFPVSLLYGTCCYDIRKGNWLPTTARAKDLQVKKVQSMPIAGCALISFLTENDFLSNIHHILYRNFKIDIEHD